MPEPIISTHINNTLSHDDTHTALRDPDLARSGSRRSGLRRLQDRLLSRLQFLFMQGLRGQRRLL
jgi:hypothetical protein